jgi:hypothetical protein
LLNFPQDSTEKSDRGRDEDLRRSPISREKLAHRKDLFFSGFPSIFAVARCGPKWIISALPGIRT